MAVVREHLVVGGDIVEQSGGFGDDDGAPPPIPGMRVHGPDDIATAGTRPMSDEELAQFGATLPKPRKAAREPRPAPAKAKKAGRAVSSDDVSDRRRCLELAIASGETDPDEVMDIAKKYLEFLQEE